MGIFITVMKKRPDKFKMQMKMNGMTIMEQIYNGEKGKVASPQGAQMMTGEELEEMKYSASLFNELSYLEDGYTVELVGIEDLNGTEAYKMTVTNPLGSKTTEYYAVNTGLKLREVKTEETPQGEFTQITDYSGYTATPHGVKFPEKMIMNIGGQEMTFTLEEAKVNSAVADSEFTIE